MQMQSSPKKIKASIVLFISAWVAYTMVCFTKTNYTALIASIVKAGIFTKSDSGFISACFYIAFGISQIVGGRFTDKKPMLAILIGLIGSLIPNIILCFVTDFVSVCILWSICGLMQFGCYPGIVKIVSGYLVPEHREKARTYVVLCIGVGGILSYALVAVVYEWLGWAGVFGMDALVLGISLLLWLYAMTKVKYLKDDKDSIVQEKQAQAKEENQVELPKNEGKQISFWKLIFSSGLILAIIINFFMTMMSNGFKSWLSTMMMECYDLSPVWASMQTAIIYIANILGTFIIAKTFCKIKNEMLAKGLAMAFCLPFYIVILFIGQVPAFVIIACSIITTTVLYGISRVNVKIASHVEKYGYSATFTGFLNAMASFGVVFANGGFGVIADKLGWNAVTVVFVAVCVIAVLGYVVGAVIWQKFKKSKCK